MLLWGLARSLPYGEEYNKEPSPNDCFFVGHVQHGTWTATNLKFNGFDSKHKIKGVFLCVDTFIETTLARKT
jgi:hypothetical protein